MIRSTTHHPAMVATEHHDATTDISTTPVHNPSSLCLTPCEVGGPTMLALKQALVDDAAAQENVPDMLGRVLDLLIAKNDQRAASECHGPVMLLLFESSSRCPLSPSEYLRRILKYTNTSPCNVLMGLVYLQRLKDTAEGRIRLTSFNIQRLLLTSTMLASKFHDDYFASNKQWALVGDLPLKELNELELDMLFHLRFSLTVTREEYDHRRNELEQLDPAAAAQGDTQASTACMSTACEQPPAQERCWDAFYQVASCKSGLDSRASPKSVSSNAAYSAPSTVCEDCVEDAPSREVAGQHHKVICVAHGLFHVKLGDEGNADVLWCQ